MDKDGWIPMSLIASFHRIQQLTHDINLLIEVSIIGKQDSMTSVFTWTDVTF
jgi:hypothetical protein